MNLKTLCTLALACSVTTLSAQKKPLDQSAYDGWKSVASPRISDKGDWICYSITPQRGDALLEFYNTTTGKITRVDRGRGAALFNNGSWASFKIAVPFDSVRKAKIAKVKADKMPKDTFAVMNLAGNIVMFIPLGFLPPCVHAEWRTFGRCMLYAAACICLVEVVQLFTLTGSCDIDDFILNMVGTAFGYLLYRTAAARFVKR